MEKIGLTSLPQINLCCGKTAHAKNCPASKYKTQFFEIQLTSTVKSK